MKISVKTLSGFHFDIEVKPEDTVSDVKKNIETVRPPGFYPAGMQVIIHGKKILKDDTTLAENGVAENSFIFLVLLRSPEESAPSPASASAST